MIVLLIHRLFSRINFNVRTQTGTAHSRTHTESTFQSPTTERYLLRLLNETDIWNKCDNINFYISFSLYTRPLRHCTSVGAQAHRFALNVQCTMRCTPSSFITNISCVQLYNQWDFVSKSCVICTDLTHLKELIFTVYNQEQMKCAGAHTNSLMDISL